MRAGANQSIEPGDLVRRKRDDIQRKLTERAHTPRKLDPSCPLAILPPLPHAPAHDIIQKTESESYPRTTSDQYCRLIFSQVNAASSIRAIYHNLNRHFQKVVRVFLWSKSSDLSEALIRERV